MKKKLRIILAQLNVTVGDIEGNLQKHIKAAITARDELAGEVIVFSELGLTGYPPEDLLYHKIFIQAVNQALNDFMARVQHIYCIIGHPYLNSQEKLQNVCSLIYNGKILNRYAKRCLPNDGVFDEYRYFTPGDTPCLVYIKDIPVSLMICEDVWHPECVQQAANDAQLICCLNASPFESNKHEQRVALLTSSAKHYHTPIIYVNQVGGQDELLFDGGSMAIHQTGTLYQLASFFQESLQVVELDTLITTPLSIPVIPLSNKIERIYQALVVGVHDYVTKNGFSDVIIGISGGIDSALTLAIAVDALGHEHVQAIIMPSRYTAAISMEDAMILTKHFGVSTRTIAIEPIYDQILTSLTPLFANPHLSITEENIQARCRAIILMALSNQYGSLVLTTGNRSEFAVGYCTLYGDMAGGFAVLKDIPKTLVYLLANYRNQSQALIPRRIIERAPTAELAPNQQDTDSLPPYPILDQILDAYLNQGKSIDEIVAQGFNHELTEKIVTRIRQNEYKRRQAPLGPRINHQAFGKDRRYPIINRFRET